MSLGGRNWSRGDRGLSLVEIVLAIAIASAGILSIISLVFSVQKSEIQSADNLSVGLLFEDIQNRVRGSVLTDGPLEQSPYFYNQRGEFTSGDIGIETPENHLFYRAETSLVTSASPAIPGTDEWAVVVKVYWPLKPDKTPRYPENPGAEFSYIVSSLSGPAWKEVDGDYEHKIEL
ncbi:MAG: hypothetical protein AAF226_06930 [Verrucomicrobiota bacterium]